MHSRLAASALLIALVACDDPLPPVPPGTIAIQLGQVPDTLGVGDSVRLEAFVSAERDPHWGAPARWESRAPAVVTIDSAGHAVARSVGDAWLVATAAGVASGRAADSAHIHVEPIARSLRIAYPRDSVSPNDTLAAQVSIDAHFGGIVDVSALRYASSDTLIASVDSLTGQVLVRGDGDVTITATDGRRTANTVLHGWLHRLDTGGVHLTRIAIGWQFGCGLDAAGVAYCWGKNARGQLGRGDRDFNSTTLSIAPVQTASRFTSIHAGRSTACGVATDGALVCWGDAIERIAPTAQARGIPTRIELPAGFGAVASVSTGIRPSVCAMDVSGRHACFGDNSYGSIGFDLGIIGTPRPVPGAPTSLTSIGPGETHGCGSDADGALWCWGYPPGWGYPGSGFTNAPARVDGVPPLHQVSAHFVGTCALDSQGAPWCGGFDSVPLDTKLLTRVTGTPALSRLDSDIDASCGPTATGVLWCWNSTSLFRTPGLMQARTPSRFSNRVSQFVEFDVGGHAICALTGAGEVLCRNRPFDLQ